ADPPDPPHPVEARPWGRALPGRGLARRGARFPRTGPAGETVRAKVPIHSSADDGTVVGEVSVGIYASILDADVRRELVLLGTVAVVALALAGIVSVMLGRRLRRATLGGGSGGLAEMAPGQGGGLRGLDAGVPGFDSGGRLTLSKSNAGELLCLPPAGDDRSASTIAVPEQITAMVDEAPAEGALRRRIT